MGKYQRFDDLPVWQESARLYQRVLDLLEENSPPFSAAFRTQFERAALAVAGHVAEGFERMAPGDQLACLADARAAAAEVQSMIAVVGPRPKLARWKEPLQQVRALAESCGRQLSAWMSSIEHGPRPKGYGGRSEDGSRPSTSAAPA